MRSWSSNLCLLNFLTNSTILDGGCDQIRVWGTRSWTPAESDAHNGGTISWGESGVFSSEFCLKTAKPPYNMLWSGFLVFFNNAEHDIVFSHDVELSLLLRTDLFFRKKDSTGTVKKIIHDLNIIPSIGVELPHEIVLFYTPHELPTVSSCNLIINMYSSEQRCQ